MDKQTSRYLDILLAIAKDGSLFDTVSTSTVALAKQLKSSQQSTSRKLVEMELLGLIRRRTNQRGITISLTDRGVGQLTYLRDELIQIITSEKTPILGMVVSGLGEGGYYVGQERYQTQFKKMLGFSAFPGTLNLRIDITQFKHFLHQKKQIVIKGFKGEHRTFGPLNCIPVMLRNKKNSVEGSLIIPERTTHPEDIAEVIAKDNLRSLFDIKDNDKVEIGAIE